MHFLIPYGYYMTSIQFNFQKKKKSGWRELVYVCAISFTRKGQSIFVSSNKCTELRNKVNLTKFMQSVLQIVVVQNINHEGSYLNIHYDVIKPRYYCRWCSYYNVRSKLNQLFSVTKLNKMKNQICKTVTIYFSIIKELLARNQTHQLQITSRSPEWQLPQGLQNCQQSWSRFKL